MESGAHSWSGLNEFVLVLHDAALTGGDTVDYTTVHWVAESAPQTEHCKLLRTTSTATAEEPTGIGLVQPTTGAGAPVEP